MDAFYASVEQRDCPQYRGKPIVVGRSEDRGVVAAASYEARRYGIRSAMSSRRALQLCPHLIFVPSRMEYYKSISRQIQAIFHEYTDVVEPLALDEAFLDVTENKTELKWAVEIARLIKQRIRKELGLVASAGISYNKFLAKIASDYRKPNGLCTIHPDKALAFIAALPVESFWGVGKVTAARMHELGLFTGADLRDYPLSMLIYHFGKAGALYHQFAHGSDNRPVQPERIWKSVGCETTYHTDLTERNELLNELYDLTDELTGRLEKSCFKGNTLTLKVKFNDFTIRTRSLTVPYLLTAREQILLLIENLLDEVDFAGRPVRLLGLSVSHPPDDGLRSDDGQLCFPF